MVKLYDIDIKYDDHNRAISMTYKRNKQRDDQLKHMHGKYLLATSLSGEDEKNKDIENQDIFSGQCAMWVNDN